MLYHHNRYCFQHNGYVHVPSTRSKSSIYFQCDVIWSKVCCLVISPFSVCKQSQSHLLWQQHYFQVLYTRICSTIWNLINKMWHCTELSDICLTCWNMEICWQECCNVCKNIFCTEKKPFSWLIRFPRFTWHETGSAQNCFMQDLWSFSANIWQ